MVSSSVFHRHATSGVNSLKCITLLPALIAAFEDAGISSADVTNSDVSSSLTGSSALEKEQAAYLSEDGFAMFQQAVLPRTPRDLADYITEKNKQKTSSGASLLELGEASASQANALGFTSYNPSSARSGFAGPGATLSGMFGMSDTCSSLMWFGYGSTDECRDSWSPELSSNCRCERQGTAWPAKYCTTGDEGQAQLALLGLGPAPGETKVGESAGEDRIALHDVWGRCEKCCSREHFIGWPLIVVSVGVFLFLFRSCIFPAKAEEAAAGNVKADASGSSSASAAN